LNGTRYKFTRTDGSFTKGGGRSSKAASPNSPAISNTENALVQQYRHSIRSISPARAQSCGESAKIKAAGTTIERHSNGTRQRCLEHAPPPIFQSIAAVAAGYSVSSSGFGQVCPAEAGRVRDRLWVFCNPRNADYNMVRQRSVMSPLESAVYLGIPNILMVNQYPGGRDIALPGQEGWYQAWEPPLEQYAFPLKVLKRVVWSIVGASGVTRDSERKQVLHMALRTPNFVGAYMDDFFHNKPDAKVSSLSLDELELIQQQLKGSSKKLDLHVTLYTNQLDRTIADYLNLIDVVTLWTWDDAELGNLEANLTRLERLAPKCRKCWAAIRRRLTKSRFPRGRVCQSRPCSSSVRRRCGSSAKGASMGSSSTAAPLWTLTGSPWAGLVSGSKGPGIQSCNRECRSYCSKG
jgi:hypothetical protein